MQVPTYCLPQVSLGSTRAHLNWFGLSKQVLLHIPKKKRYSLGFRGVGLSLTVDTKASVCISPYLEDFITYCSIKVKMRDISSSGSVAGKDMIQLTMDYTGGVCITVELPVNHILKDEVWPMTPQAV